ncbi:MAG TPA: alpha/beta hydrolase [Acidobacteriota bacterium]|jgi:pimeloyl-ACP methyl ester carboxylesterase
MLISDRPSAIHNPHSAIRNEADLLSLGSGPPLVLIGGLHGHFEFQRPIAEKLSQDFRVVCPSMPGEESPAEAPETVEETARRMLEKISAAGLDRTFLCGISLGGILALEMAVQAPRQVMRVASVVSFAEYGFLHPRLKNLFDFLVEQGLEKACRRLSRSALLALTVRELLVEAADPSICWGYWEKFRKYHSPSDLVWKRLKMIRRAALSDRLFSLKVPVLLVAAQRDRIVHPEHAVRTAQQIPQSQLWVMAGSGHLFPFLRPEKLAAVLRSFFKAELDRS